MAARANHRYECDQRDAFHDAIDIRLTLRFQFSLGLANVPGFSSADRAEARAASAANRS
jgi:hypothetical protein